MSLFYDGLENLEKEYITCVAPPPKYLFHNHHIAFNRIQSITLTNNSIDQLSINSFHQPTNPNNHHHQPAKMNQMSFPMTWDQLHYIHKEQEEQIKARKEAKAAKAAKATTAEEKKVNKLSSALRAVLKGHSTKSAQSSGVNTPYSGAATPARNGSVTNSRSASRANSIYGTFGAASHFSIK